MYNSGAGNQNLSQMFGVIDINNTFQASGSDSEANYVSIWFRLMLFRKHKIKQRMKNEWVTLLTCIHNSSCQKMLCLELFSSLAPIFISLVLLSSIILPQRWVCSGHLPAILWGRCIITWLICLLWTRSIHHKLSVWALGTLGSRSGLKRSWTSCFPKANESLWKATSV